MLLPSRVAVANRGHLDDDIGRGDLESGMTGVRRSTPGREQGSEMIALHVASFRSRWLIRHWTEDGGLLECIMHAKWRGFLEITAAAPLPDEGVLR